MSKSKTIYKQKADNKKVTIDREIIEKLKEKIDNISVDISGFQGLQILFFEKVRSSLNFTSSDLYNIWALIKSLADKSKEDLNQVNDAIINIFYSLKDNKSSKRFLEPQIKIEQEQILNGAEVVIGTHKLIFKKAGIKPAKKKKG